MSKAFVNTSQLSVNGDALFKDKKDSLKKANPALTQAQIDTTVISEPVLLDGVEGGTLLAICSKPSLVKTQNKVFISVLDDRVEIAKIDKNLLIDACIANMKPDVDRGVTYTIPLFDHAVLFDYRFQNRCETIGDISGLQFYFKK